MPFFGQAQFQEIIADEFKQIVEEVSWVRDPGREDIYRFRVAVRSRTGWPLRVVGWCNTTARKLSLVLVHDQVGRIVGLDIGPAISHANPDQSNVSGPHLHLWAEEYGDGRAEALSAAAIDWSRPEEAWAYFCAIAGITHHGRFMGPPAM